MISDQQQPIVFEVYQNGVKYNAVMDVQKLAIGSIQIKIADMIGLKQTQQKASKELLYTLYSYPKKKKLFRSQKRYLDHLQFCIKMQISQWRKKQKKIIYRINNRIQDTSLKLLICFNPNAGSNSKKHLDNILGFLENTNLLSEILTTTGRNHCLEYLKNIDEKLYCGIAIVSGDGLMHQYVNSFCQVPVAHVPAGSGNAFSKTQMEQAGQLCKDEQSIFLVIRNRPKKYNLVKYQLQKLKEPVYSLLSLQWAIIADLDLNSEHLRFLGGYRFDLYGVWLVLRKKRYPGRIIYSTIQQQIPSLQTDLTSNPNYQIIQDTFLHAIFCSIPYIAQNTHIAPLLKQQQRIIDMQIINQQSGRYHLAKYLLGIGDQFNKVQGTPQKGYKFIYNKIKSFRIQPLDRNQIGRFGIDGEAYDASIIQGSISDKTFLAFV